ncbi:MAG TPA: NUDIX hydrolase [Streptosporangiaceae bacterium]|jgi:8-oxo-dGTP pyrophosphatase MutT (NUDIX family)
MSAGDGDGWAYCDLGHEHWGTYGAAGLLVYHHDPDGGTHILLQHRSRWSHNGGTWGVLGGARDSHESPEATALREATEEAALDGSATVITGTIHDDHGGWAYDTVLASADRLLPAHAVNLESKRVMWVPVDDVPDRKLHPGFAQTWPLARTALGRLVVVVDGANVMGARADGWWRDRAGAAARLRDAIAGRLPRGLSAAALPADLDLPALDRWYPEVVLVVEGQARGIGPAADLRVVAAPGSGDDTIVAEAQAAAATPGDRVIVVTADRELRSRVTAVGAMTTGPRWILGLLDGA